MKNQSEQTNQTTDVWQFGEEHYRIVTDAASDAIISIDEESRILFANRATEKIFGYTLAELSGNSIMMLMPDYLRHVHRAGIARYIETGKRHLHWDAIEVPGLRKNGKEIPLEISFGEFVKDGKHFFTGIIRDVTERKRAERYLSAQHAATRALAESATLDDAAPGILQTVCESLAWETGALWIIDRRKAALRCLKFWHAPSISVMEFAAQTLNASLSRGSGLPGQVWETGEPAWITDITRNETFPRATAAAKEGLHGGFAFPILQRGEVFGVIEFFSREIQPPDAQLLNMMFTVGSQIGQFIEHRQVTVDLQASEQRYRTLADSMPQIVWTLAPDGNVNYLNQRWFEYTGRAHDGTLGMGWLEDVHPDDYERLVETQRKHIEAGEGYEMEARLQRRDKTYRWHLVRNLPLRNESGGNENSVLLWLGTATDIDELKCAEQARAELLDTEQRARTEAEAANRAKDEFLATLSHEMRTPLTPIMGWVRMLRDGMLEGDTAAHGLTVIDKNATSLLRLINDLLDMSAILSGKMNIEKLPIDLAEVLAEAIETVRPQAEQRGIDIEADLCDNNNNEAAAAQQEPVMVAGDRTRLVQVFWNLLNNAVKFSPEQSRIKVTCRRSETARVEVEDEGQGIAPDFLPHIFERFRQADSSNTRVYGGMGIGLALVKSFVEAHGGTVYGTSEGRACGAKFTVELPLFKTAVLEVSSTPASTTVGEKADKPARILVVEDALDTLDMLRATFESRGFHATLCQSAREALRIARIAEFDVIISDIGLPEIDGYELIKQLRSVPHLRDTPALALTGYASQQDLARALSAGFNAHVAKPVDPSLLLAQIDRQLQSTHRRNDVVS